MKDNNLLNAVSELVPKKSDIEYLYLSNVKKEKYPEVLKKMYKKKIGKELNLENPTSYNEKIQWSKLYDSRPIKTKLSDKYLVRDWIEDKIGQEYLIPLLGVWDQFDEIDFDALPNQFVLKANHGSGWNIIVRDKEKLDKAQAKIKFDKWLKKNFAFYGLEMQYKDIKPKIIAEKYIVLEDINDLPDYKFFCFHGKVFCLYTMIDYTFDHSKGQLGFFDRDYKLLPYHRLDFKPIREQVSKPKNFDKMVELAEHLSQGFEHVRVDFYNLNGKIYFGEMTFTNACGFSVFVPDEFDYIMGKEWKLPSKK